MRVAIDKDSFGAIDIKDNEYVYIFNDESYEYLKKIGLNCINSEYIKNEFVDVNLTDYKIDCIKKAKITDKDWNVLVKQDYKIGIIIPNYNYEHTIEKCLNSIFNQTYKNYEIIFVDDCSTDSSVEIANKVYINYLKEKLCGFDYISKLKEEPSMKIVRLQQKRLNGGARNEAYLHLSNDVDYVWYVDSDDWLYDENVLENINKKLQKKPDVLFVGMASYKNNKTDVCFIPEYKDRYEAMLGWSGSCGKVIKKSLVIKQECLYNEGTLKEDKNQHCKICIYMKNFELLKKPVYVWNRTNEKSVTTIRTKNIAWETSTIRHYADTKELYLSVKGKDSKIDSILEDRLKRCEKELKEGGDRQW